MAAEAEGGGTASVSLTIGLDTAKGLTFQAGTKHRIDLPGELSFPGVDLRGLGLEIPTVGPLAFEITGTIAGASGRSPRSSRVRGVG